MYATTRLLLVLIISGGLLLPTGVSADDVELSERATFRVERITGGLEHPWGVAFLPDGGYLVTERPGRLRLIDADGRLEPQPVRGMPEIAAVGQGGLLDVALHPDFATNRWVYVSYAEPGRGGIGTAVARGRLDGLQLRDTEVLFRLQPKTRASRHFGSRLVFDNDGYLFITLGDRGKRPRSQDLADHAGSVIGFTTTDAFPTTTPSSATIAHDPRSTVTATAISRVRLSTRKAVACGPTSTARRAATRSICQIPASIMAGR